MSDWTTIAFTALGPGWFNYYRKADGTYWADPCPGVVIKAGVAAGRGSGAHRCGDPRGGRHPRRCRSVHLRRRFVHDRVVPDDHHRGAVGAVGRRRSRSGRDMNRCRICRSRPGNLGRFAVCAVCAEAVRDNSGCPDCASRVYVTVVEGAPHLFVKVAHDTGCPPPRTSHRCAARTWPASARSTASLAMPMCCWNSSTDEQGDTTP